MASSKERAWLSAHQKGSRALVQRLDKVHANNPEYQAFKKKHGLGDTSSVKQVSKSTVDRAKEKARQTLAGKAYGATKGTRMGSAEGTGETLRDTIAPLTRDQHSAVKAAEREAKAAEKPAKPAAAPKKPAKPKKEKAAAPAPEKKKPTALELIAAAAAKRKINQPPVSAKALRRIAAVGDMEHDHGGFEDLGDTQYGGRHSYNEETELDEVDKHSFLGKILRKHELKKKVDSTFKDIGDAQRRGNHSAASKAFRKHERYANLERPGTWTKVKEEAEQVDEEVETFKVGDKVSIHAPDDLDWHERKGELVSTSDDGHVVKLSGGAKLSVSKHQIKKIDEEINNRITKIHVRGQNVVIHRYDTEAKGTYKKVFHHHSPAAAQQYARKLQKGSMSNPKLVIEGVEQIDETARDWKKAFASVRTKNLNKDVGALRTQVSRYDNATREDAKNRKKHLKNDLASLKKEEVEQIDEMDKEMPLSPEQRDNTAKQKPAEYAKLYNKVSPEMRKKLKLPAKLPEEAEQVDEIYALSAANYQAELIRQEKAKIEHKKNLERKAKEQLDKDSEDTGNPFASWKPVKEAKHHMGGALFADTAARLQKAINAHKERMDQMTNGPEHEYHHPTLDIKTKSRVKLPAPWAKVEDK